MFLHFPGKRLQTPRQVVGSKSCVCQSTYVLQGSQITVLCLTTTSLATSALIWLPSKNLRSEKWWAETSGIIRSFQQAEDISRSPVVNSWIEAGNSFMSSFIVFGAAQEMLYDKAAGFYSVLHESMAGTDGLRFCPTRSEGNIMEACCIDFVFSVELKEMKHIIHMT